MCAQGGQIPAPSPLLSLSLPKGILQTIYRAPTQQPVGMAKWYQDKLWCTI